MEFLELAKKRYSSRKYSAKMVEKEKLELILEAAQVAPSAHNNQAFKLIVVQTPEGLKKISKAGNIYGASLALLSARTRYQHGPIPLIIDNWYHTMLSLPQTI